MAAPDKTSSGDTDPDPTDESSGNPNTDLEHPQGDTVPATEEGGPREPTPEETPSILTAPAAIDATAVETVVTPEGEKKYGWQQAPARPELLAEPCFHTGIVQARKQVPAFEVGHEWVCICGTTFVVHVNRGGKKTLVEKEALPETEAEGLNVG